MGPELGPNCVSARVQAIVKDAGFGDIRGTVYGGWEARCLACTRPEIFQHDGEAEPTRRPGVCSSVRACLFHQERQHTTPNQVERPPRDVFQEPALGDLHPRTPDGTRSSPLASGHTSGKGDVGPDHGGHSHSVSLVPTASPSPGAVSEVGGPDSSGSDCLARATSASDRGLQQCCDTDTVSGTSSARAPGPRRGSGDWWFQTRLQPVAPGSSMSALQVAYSIAELRETGATKKSTTQVAQLLRNLLRSFGPSSVGIQNLHTPPSTYLVECVLGVPDAREFEFGWCPECGLRHPPSPNHSGEGAELLKETCPQCGTSKYKVHALLDATLCPGNGICTKIINTCACAKLTPVPCIRAL